jgi:hypothetical protein
LTFSSDAFVERLRELVREAWAEGTMRVLSRSPLAVPRVPRIDAMLPHDR